MRNSIEFRLWGKTAIFSDPITKVGGELCTYKVPTYEALKGIVEAIYWKPTINWIIDKVKIIKPIKTYPKSQKILDLSFKPDGSFKHDLAYYTYLTDVEYLVSAHFEWNEAREDLISDRNENKHHNVAKRYLERGGKRDIFLGKRECVAFVEPFDFDAKESIYKDIDVIDFGIMFHSFLYPEKQEETKLYANLDHIVMKNGIIEFTPPTQCEMRREVKNYFFEKIKTADDALDQEIIAELNKQGLNIETKTESLQPENNKKINCENLNKAISTPNLTQQYLKSQNTKPQNLAAKNLSMFAGEEEEGKL